MKLTQANTLRHGATLHSLVKPTTRTSAAKNVCRINQHKAVVVAAAAKGTKAAAGGEKNPIERLKEISKDAIQKKEAQKSQLEEANNKLAAALKDLEVAKAEAASAAKLRDEVELRTRAMENLQLQLEQVEALRNQELQASMKRFEELESALALAEGSMGSEAQRVTQLEARMASMAGELEAAAKQADDLRQQLKAAKEGTGKDVVADALEAKLAEAQKIEAGLKSDLVAAGNRAKSMEAELESLKASVAAKDAELTGSRRLSEEVAKAAEASEQELRQLHEELKSARQLEVAAAARAQELEVAAKKEAESCLQLIAKAEELAAAVGCRIEEIRAGGSGSFSEEEDSITTRSSDLGSLTEADVELVLDELELLRGELEAELLTSEELTDKLSASEAEAAELRKQLAALASAGDENAASIGGFSQTLVQELASSRAEAAASVAEVDSMKVTIKALNEEVQRLRQQVQGASKASANAAASRFGGGNKELAAALEKVAELEKVNAELRDSAVVREAALAEGRKFLRSYLERSLNNEVQAP